MQTVMPGLGLQKFYSFGMETSDAAMRRAGNFKFARFAAHLRGHFLECSSARSFLDDERWHGNKILKDEQHLFTHTGRTKITEEKSRSNSGMGSRFGILYS